MSLLANKIRVNLRHNTEEKTWDCLLSWDLILLPEY